MKYITYHINGQHKNYTPIAVDLSDLTDDKKLDVYFDAKSLAGLSHVRINKGVHRKIATVITAEEHFKYDWDRLEKDHYNKYYNPKNY